MNDKGVKYQAGIQALCGLFPLGKSSSGKGMDIKMIKNVVFDIGNVLAGFVWREFYESFGFSEETIERLAKVTVKSEFWNEMDRGKMDTGEILDSFIAIDPSVETEIREIFRNVKGMIKRYDYAVPWIKELKERGYGIYIISNFAEKAHEDCLEALDFLEEADGAILSYQDKLIKPSPQIYRLLCSRYGLRPEECVFIDDLPENVEAARKEGMKSIVFHTREQAVEELEAVLSC